ncbi:hypothetical protein HDV00_004712 [Rhizophlyctis rosea]|nr:hypothetical protein HDV00_004712 [Rhizophlyctis rosea]
MGKFTFVSTLCELPVSAKNGHSYPEKAAVVKTVAITTTSVGLYGGGRYQAVADETKGVHNINNEGRLEISQESKVTCNRRPNLLHKSFHDILEYIEQQYDTIPAQESGIKGNRKLQDNRIHALLYFIAPTGHAYSPKIDIEFMRRLGPRANVIPVIAKADNLSSPELAAFEKAIMEDIVDYKLPIYDFPHDEEEEDEGGTIEENDELRSMLQSTVIGSEEEVILNGRRIRCRQYPRGYVDVDNPQHCDFSKLRFMVFGSHLQDLKEITHDHLHEQYRTEKLSKDGDVDPEEEEEQRRQQEAAQKAKYQARQRDRDHPSSPTSSAATGSPARPSMDQGRPDIQQAGEQTKEAVTDFARPGGIGEELQRRLLERQATKETSWLIDWWNDHAYMSYRDPTVINVSYSFVFKDDKRRRDPSARAASIITAALEFRRLIAT